MPRAQRRQRLCRPVAERHHPPTACSAGRRVWHLGVVENGDLQRDHLVTHCALRSTCGEMTGHVFEPTVSGGSGSAPMDRPRLRVRGGRQDECSQTDEQCGAAWAHMGRIGTVLRRLDRSCGVTVWPTASPAPVASGATASLAAIGPNPAASPAAPARDRAIRRAGYPRTTHWLAFIASVVRSLAWPLALVGVALLLRTQIQGLLTGRTLSMLKAGMLEFQFESIAAEGQAELEAETPSAATEPEPVSNAERCDGARTRTKAGVGGKNDRRTRFAAASQAPSPDGQVGRTSSRTPTPA